VAGTNPLADLLQSFLNYSRKNFLKLFSVRILIKSLCGSKMIRYCKLVYLPMQATFNLAWLEMLRHLLTRLEPIQVEPLMGSHCMGYFTKQAIDVNVTQLEFFSTDHLDK
jgi:hypothetical protein